MRKLSRWLPPVPPPRMPYAGWIVLGVFSVGLAIVLLRHPLGTLSILGALAAVSYILTIVNNRRLRREATARPGEDIGTFARALDRRAPNFDPWIVRAVWDALQPYVRYGEQHLPIRPSDRLDEDLRMDPDDLPELAVEIALRVGRSSTDWQRNPKAHSVRTVADLIALIEYQPPEAAA